MATSTKSLKDMSVSEIIKGVKSGKIPSCEYKTYPDYLKAMHKV
jgi:hypothetical protein